MNLVLLAPTSLRNALFDWLTAHRPSYSLRQRRLPTSLMPIAFTTSGTFLPAPSSTSA